ncbi:MAG: hypothetical protein JRD93_20815 [Deltaproteobacteria bacterium]|nr:hypothetical protein [Deltaproteobacteria bacterium]
MKILLGLLMAVLFLGGQAVADEGDICDGQVGAAYGLCQAYCIAMDCAGSDPLGTEEACSKVLNLFEKNTGSLPPCCTVKCPLWTKEELEETYGRTECCVYTVNDGIEGSCDDGHIKIYDECHTDSSWLSKLMVKEIYELDGDCTPDSHFGGYFEIHEGTTIHWVESMLTEEEAARCKEDIADYSFTQCDTSGSD